MRTRQGETICLGIWIRPASALSPLAGGVLGGMRAGFQILFLQGRRSKKLKTNIFFEKAYCAFKKPRNDFQYCLFPSDVGHKDFAP